MYPDKGHELLLTLVFVSLSIKCLLGYFFFLPGLTPLTLSDLVFPQFSLSPPPAPLCPYVKDGKQLPTSWISQHPVAFGRLPGLTGLTCSFTHFGRLDGNNDKRQTDPLLSRAFDPGFST